MACGSSLSPPRRSTPCIPRQPLPAAMRAPPTCGQRVSVAWQYPFTDVLDGFSTLAVVSQEFYQSLSGGAVAFSRLKRGGTWRSTSIPRSAPWAS